MGERISVEMLLGGELGLSRPLEVPGIICIIYTECIYIYDNKLN
jgi:hypothetical protein